MLKDSTNAPNFAEVIYVGQDSAYLHVVYNSDIKIISNPTLACSAANGSIYYAKLNKATGHIVSSKLLTSTMLLRATAAYMHNNILYIAGQNLGHLMPTFSFVSKFNTQTNTIIWTRNFYKQEFALAHITDIQLLHNTNRLVFAGNCGVSRSFKGEVDTAGNFFVGFPMGYNAGSPSYKTNPKFILTTSNKLFMVANDNTTNKINILSNTPGIFPYNDEMGYELNLQGTGRHFLKKAGNKIIYFIDKTSGSTCLVTDLSNNIITKKDFNGLHARSLSTANSKCFLTFVNDLGANKGNALVNIRTDSTLAIYDSRKQLLDTFMLGAFSCATTADNSYLYTLFDHMDTYSTAIRIQKESFNYMACYQQAYVPSTSAPVVSNLTTTLTGNGTSLTATIGIQQYVNPKGLVDTTLCNTPLAIADFTFPPQLCTNTGYTFSGVTANVVSSWSMTGTTLSNPILQNQPVTFTASGVFSATLSVTNSGGTSQIIKTFTVNATPTLAVSVATICAGQSYTIAPTGASNYTYTTGSAIISPANTLTYMVTGESHGCFNSAASQLQVNPMPTVTVNSGTICAGQSFTIAPTGAANYTYSTGSAIVSPANTLTYTVTGGTQGCFNSATGHLQVNPSPNITVNSGTICSGDSFTFMPTGAASYSYNSGSPVVSPAGSLSYLITGSNATGCSQTVMAYVIVKTTPDVAVSSASICAGESYTVTPTGASHYTYSTGPVILSPANTLTYTVTGESQGCLNSVTGYLQVNPLPVITVSSGTICSGNSYTLLPTGALSYSYSSGSPVVTPSGSMSYLITGSDAAGCKSTAMANVAVNPLPLITAGATQPLACALSPVTFTAAGAVTYSWSTSSSTQSVTGIFAPLVSTMYTVTGTDANGCQSSTGFLQNVAACTGIQSSVVRPGSRIYPNPNNGEFIIETEVNTEISIISATGQMMYTGKTTELTTGVSLKELAPGVYFVKLTGSSGRHLVKLIKE